MKKTFCPILKDECRIDCIFAGYEMGYCKLYKTLDNIAVNTKLSRFLEKI